MRRPLRCPPSSWIEVRKGWVGGRRIPCLPFGLGLRMRRRHQKSARHQKAREAGTASRGHRWVASSSEETKRSRLPHREVPGGLLRAPFERGRWGQRSPPVASSRFSVAKGIFLAGRYRCRQSLLQLASPCTSPRPARTDQPQEQTQEHAMD